MRNEWWNRGYADGVAYVQDYYLDSRECPNCGVCDRFYVEHESCGACVLASVEYSQRHGVLSDGLADVHTGGRVLPRVNGALVAGFLFGVRAGLAGVRA